MEGAEIDKGSSSSTSTLSSDPRSSSSCTTHSHSDVMTSSSVLAVIQVEGRKHHRHRCHCRSSPKSKRPKVSGNSDLNPPLPLPLPLPRPRGADLISRLPDFLIQEILSLLPLQEAIKTCVLSQRWKPLWTEMPALCFMQTTLGLDQQLSKFADFVDKTLDHFAAPKVKDFVICFKFTDSMASSLDNWVLFATTHHVENLSLVFNDRLVYPSFAETVYRLPQFLYQMNSSLQSLNLRQCDLWPETHVSWPSLRVLSVYYSRFNEDALERILSGSPNLQSLKLRGCEGIHRISSKSLEILEIDGMLGPSPDHRDADCVTEISCPNLFSISLSGNMYKKRFKLKHVACISEANLSFLMTVEDNDKYDCTHHRYILRELIEKLGHIEKLTVGTWCIEVLSIWKINGTFCPLSRRQCLVLDTEICEWDLHGIVSLLQSSTYLKKLVINLSPRDRSTFEFRKDFFASYEYAGVEALTSADWIFKCFLQSLESIEITGFLPSYSDRKLLVDLMEFLLKNALALKTVLIYAKDGPTNGFWEFSDEPLVDNNLENAKRLDIIKTLAKTIPREQHSCT